MKCWIISFLFCFYGIASGGEPGHVPFRFTTGSLQMSALPRLDALKFEFFSWGGDWGLASSGLTFRSGKWQYSVDERTYDRWGRLTAQTGYNSSSKYLFDVFPVSLFYSPYSGADQSIWVRDVRIFYEYSSTWLRKDQHDLLMNCDFANNFLGNRTVQDIGVSFETVGDMRLRLGHVLIKRAGSSCSDGEYKKTYTFGQLNVSRWYAGLEVRFGKTTKKSSQGSSSTGSPLSVYYKGLKKGINSAAWYFELIGNMMVDDSSGAGGN